MGLFREPKSKVFVLQATMRCLRAIGQAQHTGRVFLSDDNLNTLNDELQQNFRISADELQKTAKDKERVEVRVVEPPVKIKLVRVRKQYQMREKQVVTGQALMPERADPQKWGGAGREIPPDRNPAGQPDRRRRGGRFRKPHL